MTAIEKQRLERAAKVAQIIAEHPDLPMMCLAPSTPCDFDSYYHEVCGASVDSILKPYEVERKYGTYCGLSDEKYYTDETDAMEDVAEWLFESWYDVAVRYGMNNGPLGLVESNDDRLTEFIGADNSYTAADLSENVAWKIVEDMPWHDYIVIDCY